MKDYKDVVSDRFDNEGDNANSIYSESHPIGRYSRKVLYKHLRKYLSHYQQKNDALDTKQLMDVGCGNGGMIDFFIGEGFLPENSTGVDLSQHRIKKAQEKYPECHFAVGDVLTFKSGSSGYDFITAFDLFSHLTTQEQLITGLSNIKNHLKDDGVFLWYDIYSEDHFSPSQNADSWGFSKDQMYSMAKEAGLEPIYYSTLFKAFFNKYHSVYQAKRLPAFVLQILEKILPGTPGNMLLVLKKHLK